MIENVKQIKKIDIHAHATAFPEIYPYAGYPGGQFCSAEEVIEIYDKINVEKGVLLPLTAPEAQVSPITSEECKFLADKHSDRFIWFCGVDPRALSNSPKTDLSIRCYQYSSICLCGIFR